MKDDTAVLEKSPATDAAQTESPDAPHLDAPKPDPVPASEDVKGTCGC